MNILRRQPCALFCFVSHSIYWLYTKKHVHFKLIIKFHEYFVAVAVNSVSYILSLLSDFAWNVTFLLSLRSPRFQRNSSNQCNKQIIMDEMTERNHSVLIIIVIIMIIAIIVSDFTKRYFFFLSWSRLS